MMSLGPENVSPEDIAKFTAFVDSIADGPLKVFLTPLAEILGGGGHVFMATPDDSADFTFPGDDDEPLPPGIYPPPT